MRIAGNKLKVIAVVTSLWLPMFVKAQRDIAGYYADESERWAFLDLHRDGRYVFTMPARCGAPDYIDSGKYEVRGDTVFITSGTGDSIQGNLLIITHIPEPRDVWFWELNSLVDIYYDKEFIPENVGGRLNAHQALSGFGYKRKKKY